MNKKILHISTSNSGGAGKAALRLHQALLNNGIDSSFLALNNKLQKLEQFCVFDGKVEKQIKPPDYPLLTLKNYFRERLLKKYENEVIKFKIQTQNKKNFRSKIIQDNKHNKFELFTTPFSEYDITTCSAYKEADIIHLHWVADFLDYTSFFEKNKKPVVWTLHDENPFRGAFHYLNDEIKNKLEYEYIDNEYKEIKTASLKKQEKIIAISPSDWLMKTAKESPSFSNRKVFKINNTIDTTLFSLKNKSFCRDYLRLPKDKLVVLFAAQDISNFRKGFDLINPILFDERFKNVHFLIVGENTNNIINERFHFLNQISDDRLMPLIYSAADCLILPSREDNLPNTMIESLSCGTPVISFEVGGMSEEIEPGVNGILCDGISSEKLSKGLSEFIINKNKFNSELISNLAHSKYSEKIISEKYLQVYNDITVNN